MCIITHEPLKEGLFNITNLYNFTDFSNFELHWEILWNGVIIKKSGPNFLQVKPGLTSLFKTNYQDITFDPKAKPPNANITPTTKGTLTSKTVQVIF